MKELTKAEEQIMEYLWKLDKAFVRDILDQFPEPKPAYTTVSTMVRILETKGMVGHTAFGKNYQYYPLVNKNEYAGLNFRHVLSKHFNNSLKRFASFFASEPDVTLGDLEDLKQMLEKEIEKRKDQNDGNS